MRPLIYTCDLVILLLFCWLVFGWYWWTGQQGAWCPSLSNSISHRFAPWLWTECITTWLNIEPWSNLSKLLISWDIGGAFFLWSTTHENKKWLQLKLRFWHYICIVYDSEEERGLVHRNSIFWWNRHITTPCLPSYYLPTLKKKYTEDKEGKVMMFTASHTNINNTSYIIKAEINLEL